MNGGDKFLLEVWLIWMCGVVCGVIGMIVGLWASGVIQ